jgi:hypothetical protein
MDSHIMDAICNCKQFTDIQVRQINACRLYLKVTLMSDITTHYVVNVLTGRTIRATSNPK